nr:MAG: hypothetical protein [Caudoviricetes sp.]
MSDYREGLDYVFVIPEDEGLSVNIRVNSGEYSGVVFNFGKVSVEEDEKNEQAYLLFEYTVVDSNGFDDLESNMEFKNHIGDILTSIITKDMDKKGSSEVFTE